MAIFVFGVWPIDNMTHFFPTHWLRPFQHRWLINCLITALVLFLHGRSIAQENLKYFLLAGVETAENVTSQYLAPAEEALMYALTGGWYNSAVVRDKWTLEISLVTNGTFVPSEKRTFELNTNIFDNLSTPDGELRVRVPTILGGRSTNVDLRATLDGEDFDFETPGGPGLLDTNLMPSIFVQAKLALPKGTEVGLRFFPVIEIDDKFKTGLLGFSGQHEFSRWIPKMDNSKLAFSAFVAYTSLLAKYSFDTGGLVTGEDQLLDGRLDSWLFELVGSTKFRVFNVYGGLGYVTGDARVLTLGTYVIQTNIRTIEFEDPLRTTNRISGIRANIGATLNLNWFGVNAAYTFQGYNNLSLGLNFTIN